MRNAFFENESANLARHDGFSSRERTGRSAERRKVVGDAKKEDHADDATIRRPGPRDGVVEAGLTAANAEGSANGCGHKSIHGDKSEGKSQQAEQAARGAAEVRGEKEERQLAGGFGAHAVQHADDEDRFSGIHPLKTLRLRRLAIPHAALLPRQPKHAVDGNGQAAFDAAVGVAMCVFAEDSGDNADAEKDEREADEALGPVVEPLRQAHVQLEYGNAERGYSEGVAEGVRHAQAQAAAPVALHGGNVGDGGEVIVVEAVTQPQQQAGAKCGVKFPVCERDDHAAQYRTELLRPERRLSRGCTNPDFVVVVVDGYDGLSEERAVGLCARVGSLREAGKQRILTHDVRRACEHRRAPGRDAFDFHGGEILCVNPHGALDKIGSFLPRAHREGVAIAAVDALNAAGNQLEHIVGGGEPRGFAIAGFVDALLVLDERIEDKVFEDFRAGFGDDGVALPGFSVVGGLYGHLCCRMGLVAASVDGVMLGDREAEDGFEPCLDRRINVLDDRCLVRRGRLRACEGERGRDEKENGEQRANPTFLPIEPHTSQFKLAGIGSAWEVGRSFAGGVPVPMRYACVRYEAQILTGENCPNRERHAVLVRGVVQGVGFRPFVYRLALEEGLAGSIGNDSDGVTIEVEGSADRLDTFVARLRTETPPLARIDSVAVKELRPTGENGFRIVASEVLGRVSTAIPADAATCADCLRELFDPDDRRYRYPFLNCTNCGPRFTITRRVPYDRPQTSMARFTMCADCKAEYVDPADRRFHAQPNGCWKCGPQVSLVSAQGAIIPDEDPVAVCIDRLAGGEIMAIKGVGGFHLCVDATKDAAVTRLRERKRRFGKPLAVMVKDIEAARAICALTAEDEALLTTSSRPIVLVRKREDCGIAKGVAPGVPWLGVFLPYAPLQHLLFDSGKLRALVMTSGNLSEEPIAIDNDEALARLHGIADAFLMHDREILQRCDDSVAAVVDGAPQLMRRARGFVPLGVGLPIDSAPLLAVGGHLKSVFALARGRFVYQSQHLGDLENLDGLEFFRESLDHLMRTFEIEPQTVVHDLHPGYLSTTWAKEWGRERRLELIGVQHHHAHAAGCMAEHGLTGAAIGVVLDGTGFGTDGKIWGGEVLIARLDGFERFAHLEYVPMPGGDAAVKEPWRMALGALDAAGFDVESEQMLALLGAEPSEARLLKRMIERQINSPMTSSLGRLFDAVACVVRGRRVVEYEAQAAIELEGIAASEPDRFEQGEYVPELHEADEGSDCEGVIRTGKMWDAVLKDLWRGVPASRIAARFHAGIAEGFINAAANARIKTSINVVALSGGCMHNRRLARLLRAGLEEEGFKVFMHRQVSPGDGGLSYGQAAVAAAILGAKS